MGRLMLASLSLGFLLKLGLTVSSVFEAAAAALAR